jgi:antitoxin component of RelBE/YafQ-DinJ toxin-antitoxin module
MEAVMDKIMSTRMDESIIKYIGALSKELGLPKKTILENAVRLYAEKIASEQGFDILTHTFGGWKREETPAEIVEAVKKAMRQSQERYKR